MRSGIQTAWQDCAVSQHLLMRSYQEFVTCCCEPATARHRTPAEESVHAAGTAYWQLREGGALPLAEYINNEDGVRDILKAVQSEYCSQLDAEKALADALEAEESGEVSRKVQHMLWATFTWRSSKRLGVCMRMVQCTRLSEQQPATNHVWLWLLGQGPALYGSQLRRIPRHAHAGMWCDRRNCAMQEGIVKPVLKPSAWRVRGLMLLEKAADAEAYAEEAKRAAAYEGTYNGMGRRECALAKVVYENQDLYVGSYEDDLRSGKGMYVFANKGAYAGE